MSGKFGALRLRKFPEWKIAQAENSERGSSAILPSVKFTNFHLLEFSNRKIDSADNGKIEE